MPTTFWLASQSPRRRHLLSLLGSPVVARISGVNEDVLPGQDPVAYVEDVARRKAEAVAALTHADPRQSSRPVIVAADTTVVIDDTILGKPASAAEAEAMLRQQRGRTHQVHTGLCVIDLNTGREILETHTARVTMRDYTDAEIQDYIATGDPLDKAGAYGIQHAIFRPVAHLDGCFMGVMGLSLCHLVFALRQLELPIEITLDALHAAHEGYPCYLLSQLTNQDHV